MSKNKRGDAVCPNCKQVFLIMAMKSCKRCGTKHCKNCVRFCRNHDKKLWLITVQ